MGSECLSIQNIVAGGIKLLQTHFVFWKMGLIEAHTPLNINKLFVFVRDVTVSSILLDCSVESLSGRSWTLDSLFR